MHFAELICIFTQVLHRAAGKIAYLPTIWPEPKPK